MRDDLPSGTVTFLFSDVEGSTKLLHSLGAEAYADALAEHRRVIREACGAEGGVEVDTQGDAFFFAFPTASGALTAAAVLTESLALGPIYVRVGLHTGQPLVTDEGYVGDDVHFAARVGASAHGGQVVLSDATRALVDGVALTDLGEHRLKDIEGAVSIYQLGPKTFPPLKTISNTNLPRPASSFVGREHEISAVLAKIESGARLLTLTGPGGSGKTRLAVEAAATLVPSYKAGVFWVGLASLREASLVMDTIAQTLGAKDNLAEHIAEREMLLLLDNLEQVIEAAPALSGLVQACPNLTLFCTSRELLRVQGEVEFAVPPLATSEAVSLFCERSALEPTDEIAELCAHLDDLPLGVELAAARTKALSPAQILERLSDRLDLLKGGRDADARQQTLRATIAWSYDLLSEEEQRVFLALSVFVGGCTLEAGEEVAEADLDSLQSLVEKSLLRFTSERYWMLETIREFAAEQLAPSAEAERLARRHLAYYFALAEDVDEHRKVGEYELGRIEEERDNLRSAFDTALALDPEQALELAGRLGLYWNRRGLYREGRQRLAAALAAAPAARASARARALSEAGNLASLAGGSRRRRATRARGSRAREGTRRQEWVGLRAQPSRDDRHGHVTQALRSSSTRSRSRSTKRPGTRQADSPRCKISRPTRSQGATTSGRSRSCARGSQVPVVATPTLSRSPSVCSALPSRRTVRARRLGSRSRRASRYVACTVSRGQKRRCCGVSPTSCGRRVLRGPSSTTGRASSSPGTMGYLALVADCLQGHRRNRPGRRRCERRSDSAQRFRRVRRAHRRDPQSGGTRKSSTRRSPRPEKRSGTTRSMRHGPRAAA